MRSKFYKFLDCFSSAYLRKHSSNLRVLAYHTVPDSLRFEKQIQYLTTNYNIIDLRTLQVALQEEKKLPSNSLLITFDDGDISVYENGLPILKKYKVPAVVFIISSLIGTTKSFWWRTVEDFYDSQGKSYPEARQQVNFLKSVPNRERKRYLLSIPHSEQLQLNVDQLKELCENGIEIANHTHTHPMVDKCSIEELEEELNNVQYDFKNWEFSHFNVFAYPNGNWDLKTESYLRKREINLAFLFDHKINPESINPMRISRISVDANEALAEFRVKVSGLHTKILSLRKSLRF